MPDSIKMLTTTDEQTETMSLTELHETIPISQLSDQLNGERKYDAERWFQFRKDLEKFVDRCQTAAKFYIQSMKRLRTSARENSWQKLWPLGSAELRRLSENLKNEFETQCPEQMSDFENFGREKLANLVQENTELEHLPHYKEAVIKVTSFFDEVCRVLSKHGQEIERLLSCVDSLAILKDRSETAENLLNWFNNEGVEILENLNIRPTCFKDAHTLSVEFGRLTTLEFEPKLTETETLLENNQTPNIIYKSTKLFDARILEKLDVLEEKLKHTSQEFKVQLELTGNFLHICETCYKMCDDAYDWALNCLKLTSSLKKFLATVDSSTISANKSMEIGQNFMEKLSKCLATNPKNDKTKLARMRKVVQELQDERLILQCQAVELRCLETEEMLEEQRDILESVLKPVNKVSNVESSSKEKLQYADGNVVVVPRTSTTTLTDATFSQLRRRSYAAGFSGTHSASSLRDMGRLCLGNKLARKNRSLDCLVEEGDLTTEEAENDRESQTSNEASTNDTLRRKVNERRQLLRQMQQLNSLAACQTPSTTTVPSVYCRAAEPAACFSSNGHDSLPCSSSATSSSSYFLQNYPSRASSSSRASTSSTFLDALLQTSSDYVMPRNLLGSLTKRQSSLETLESLDDGSYRSRSSTSSAPMRFGAKKQHSSPPPFHAPPLPNVPPPPLPPASQPSPDAVPGAGWRLRAPPLDATPACRMQFNVVNELLLTEVAYVRSLRYVIENYIPELQRSDLPHQMIGKRSAIFGNLEKIYEFHVSNFLPDLIRHCSRSTESLGAYVSRCFMKHRHHFHLYALYSKNKPRSDALMAECGSDYFKKKQLDLDDKMDLSSYLLKPVQRIGKYTLMMQNLLKACSQDECEQKEMLKQVEEMLIFQLRHGNDLLAMDSIQNCDMSLKEQGQLIRQDEFVVYEGKSGKKCLRRIFLFQNLVLFTKPRRMRKSLPHSSLRCWDVYEYKYSIMMTDVGLTANVADNELKFEIWFRRHTSNAIFQVLAPSMAVKNVWIADLTQMLWDQAFRNREDRLCEMMSMGIGSKTCLDLQHSEDRIQNRAVSNGLLVKACRSRNSLPSCVDMNKFNLTSSASKRPQSLISVDSSGSATHSSTSSSSFQAGLQPHQPGGSLKTTVTTTPMSSESGFAELVTLEEDPDDCIVSQQHTVVE